ncbi:MAG: 1-acyl-sn-glycerol-3-phosphate acyltransferase [Gammaproteobacteria bacterium]|nr:1-acyl-sn-glycerol-3-phosphate acyltransferase [Gammaproteobacteria bacterium]MCP5136117.1 1-acyl-sn-glycerol-3-phosphate acyltransferase [Gammaproteobacteria bacterium]
MLIFLRSLLFSVGTVIATVLFSVGALFTLPFPFSIRYAFIIRWAWFVMWWLKVTCGISHTVIGRENISDRNAILFSKHQSTWETLAIQKIFPVQAWVLKQELLSVPFFGWALRLMEPIAINRSAGSAAVKKLIKDGKARLDAGRWVVVFPEGTRVAPGVIGRYGIGGAMLAQSSRYPVVPMAHNAGEFWPRRGFLKRPGVITVSIGPEIESEGRKADEILELAKSWIETEMIRISSSLIDHSPAGE